MSGPEGASGVKEKFQKTLILVFEVIMQPPKTHFFCHFQKCKKHIVEKKSETKIMKITHSVRGIFFANNQLRHEICNVSNNKGTT